jgi:hypothetical protein
MGADPQTLLTFPATVDWLYAGLIQFASMRACAGLEPGLGGSLIYAGELEDAGSALVTACNIAGAASLSASVNEARQRQAIRDGVIDFLVANMDEALRIIESEIRMCHTVAVCVAQSPEKVESEMVRLGVLPDLLPPGVLDAPAYKVFLDRGARQVDPVSATGCRAVLTWKVSTEGAQWMPSLDAIARDCLFASRNTDAWSARRWLRLFPRYLGRMAQGVRLLRCDMDVANAFLDRVRDQLALGCIPVPVEIHMSSGSESELHLLAPVGGSADEEELNQAERRPLQSGPTIQ